jgi:hypothetical protein
MTNNFFKLLWLPILINASDYYTPEAARARAEESIRRFGARYDVYTDKAISQQAPFNKPMQSAQQNQATRSKNYNQSFYRPQPQADYGQQQQVMAPRYPHQASSLKNMGDVYGNRCQQNTISSDLNKKITEYAYRYDLSPEVEADMKSRAGYNELMVEEMQILDQIYIDDIPAPIDEPMVCRKRGCPYYKCYRKKNCTCC